MSSVVKVAREAAKSAALTRIIRTRARSKKDDSTSSALMVWMPDTVARGGARSAARASWPRRLAPREIGDQMSVMATYAATKTAAIAAAGRRTRGQTPKEK